MIRLEPGTTKPFRVQVIVANAGDHALVRRGLLQPDQVRRAVIDAVVGPVTNKLVLPQTVVRKLDLPAGDPILIQFSDGYQSQRAQAENVYVELNGRHGTFTAIVEPRRRTALIGTIVLEDLDLLVDCKHQRLVPRDPKGPVGEVE